MNYIDFTKLGGYRLKQATFEKMQSSYYSILNAFLQFLKVPTAGNFIISGCEISGLNITPGIMFIDGELCEFDGGLGTSATLIKKNVELESLTFKNGNSHQVFRKTKAVIHNTEGVALDAFVSIKIDWLDIQNTPGFVIDPAFGSEPAQPTLIERLAEIEKKVAVFQTGGGMVLWNKPAIEIPEGWQEVADWRGRMPVGFKSSDVDFNTVGAVGGAKGVTLTTANMPKEDIRPIAVGSTYNASVIKTDGAVVGQTPDPTQVNIMNPYRVVYFIEYIG